MIFDDHVPQRVFEAAPTGAFQHYTLRLFFFFSSSCRNMFYYMAMVLLNATPMRMDEDEANG